MFHHNKHEQHPKLKRSLSIFDATIYGIGVIIGAGIYALIGQGAGIAGSSVWISFIFAGIIAGFSALSYAELSSMFPKAGAEFNFVKHAFGSNFLAFFTGYCGIFANAVSVAVVALAFAGYLQGLVALPLVPIALALIIAMSLLNFTGIKESARYTLISTLLEVGGIILIIILGASFIGSANVFEVPDPANFAGSIFSAAALIFFAFVGFEQVANISEETKNAARNIPKAVLLSLLLTTIIYILVSIVSISAIPWAELSESTNPIALVAGKVIGPEGSFILSIIALFATSNTVLVLLIVASRMLYGISKQSALPSFFQKIHESTQTPYIAVFAAMILSAIFLLIEDLGKIALLSNYFIFMMFFMVNASAIKFRFTHPNAERPFKIPFSIGNIPVIPLLGAASCLFMLLYINEPLTLFGITLPLVLYGVLLSLLAAPIYLAFKHRIQN